MLTTTRLIRLLIEQQMDYEVELKALNMTLAAMRTMYPDFPALNILQTARTDSELREFVEIKYSPLLTALGSVDERDLMAMLPSAKWEN